MTAETRDPLDPLIHVPARLRILVTLATLNDGDTLSFTHLRKLEDAGYLSTKKTSGNGVGSRTAVTLNLTGRAALDAYTAALRDLLTGL